MCLCELGLISMVIFVLSQDGPYAELGSCNFFICAHSPITGFLAWGAHAMEAFLPSVDVMEDPSIW